MNNSIHFSFEIGRHCGLVFTNCTNSCLPDSQAHGVFNKKRNSLWFLIALSLII